MAVVISYHNIPNLGIPQSQRLSSINPLKAQKSKTWCLNVFVDEIIEDELNVKVKISLKSLEGGFIHGTVAPTHGQRDLRFMLLESWFAKHPDCSKDYY